MARKQRVKARAIEPGLPDADFIGLVGVDTRDDRFDRRAQAIKARNNRLEAIRSLPIEALVPERVRLQYAERWRDENEDLQREEALTAAYRWRAIFRRLIDRIVGRPASMRPPAPPRFPFQG